MKQTLNIGAIGLGRLGYHHATNVTRSVGANLYAVSDQVPQALEKAEQNLGAKGYADYRDLLQDPAVDAIVVATPTQTHFQVLMDAIPTGKPIFCEKPITFLVGEAEEIIRQVEKHNSFLMVGYMRRYDPGHVAAKKMIESGACGEPIYLHDCSRDPAGPPPAYVPQSGGLFVDMGIHDLDVARWLMGSEIIEILARGAVLKHDFLKELDDVDDGQMLLKFESGALGMIEISRNGTNVYDCRTEVVGKKQMLLVGQSQMTPLTVLDNQARSCDMSNWVLERFKDAYEREMQDFVDCVRAGRPSPVDAVDGMIGIRLALAATESFRKGQAVTLTYNSKGSK